MLSRQRRRVSVITAPRPSCAACWPCGRCPLWGADAGDLCPFALAFVADPGRGRLFPAGLARH